MTVLELRKALEDMPDDALVINEIREVFGPVTRVYSTDEYPRTYFDGYEHCVVIE